MDTSALIAAWNENYPPDVFPAFWERIDEVVEQGRFRAPDEVLSELGKVDDDPHAWLKERSESVLRELDEELQIAAAEVLAKFPELTKKGRGRADPFVVAMARVEGGIVVTKEKPGSVKTPRIPDACHGFDVACCTILELIRAERWSF